MIVPRLAFAVSASLAAVALGCTTACAQQREGGAPPPPPTTKVDPPKAPQEPGAKADAQEREQVLKLLRDAGIDLDAAERTITIPVRTNQPADLIEYLLISGRGKSHEALLLTEVQPSLLNAAFLALGYDQKQGVNATWREKTPPPTEAQIEAGVEPMELVPPKGQQVWITLELPGPDGKPPQRVAIEDLIVDLEAENLLRNNEWIYLGGRMAAIYRNEPEVFLADFEGNVVSVCYLHPANHLVTMKHERARDDHNWWKNDKLFPVPGTELRMTFHRQKPDVVVQREKRLAAEDAAKKAGEAGKPQFEKPAEVQGARGR